MKGLEVWYVTEQLILQEMVLVLEQEMMGAQQAMIVQLGLFVFLAGSKADNRIPFGSKG